MALRSECGGGGSVRVYIRVQTRTRCSWPKAGWPRLCVPHAVAKPMDSLQARPWLPHAAVPALVGPPTAQAGGVPAGGVVGELRAASRVR